MTNPKGIIYGSSISVFGNFDAHQNPLNTGSYKTNLYDKGSFGTLPEHQSDWITTVVATTTSMGMRQKHCLICGEIICQEELPMIIDPVECDHKFGEWIAVILPTCTETGMEERGCALCDHTETRAIDTQSHDYKTVVLDPTCTEQGYASHTCFVCGNSYKDSYTDPNGHTLDTNAMCTVCGYTVTDESSHILGDVNSDGKISNIDRTILARYLANWANYPRAKSIWLLRILTGTVKLLIWTEPS